MNPLKFPGQAVRAYIGIVRWPVDRALDALGRNGAAHATVDHADAAVRGAAGTVLGDETLQREAKKKGTAARQRQRAARLREAAEETRSAAQQQADERKQQAEQRKQQAAKQAQQRKQQADKTAEQRKQSAARSAKQREQAVDTAEQRRKDQAEKKAKRERLEALETKATGLDERDDALTASDEATRLREAAEQAKAARKSD